MKMKLSVMLLCVLSLFSGCDTSSISNKAKGGTIGGTAGAALGALIGAFAGKGKGAAIGAAVGAAVGGGAGVLIGNKMDKAKKAAEMANAQAEVIKDSQTGLTYVKVTFDSGLLFATGQNTLSAAAERDLSTFAKNLTSDMNLQIYGYTDNQGWKNSTAEQSTEKNLKLSEQRAKTVSSFMVKNGIHSYQVKDVKGFGEANPVATNATTAGQQLNRRVEVYVIPSDQMINNAKREAGE